LKKNLIFNYLEIKVDKKQILLIFSSENNKEGEFCPEIKRSLPYLRSNNTLFIDSIFRSIFDESHKLV